MNYAPSFYKTIIACCIALLWVQNAIGQGKKVVPHKIRYRDSAYFTVDRDTLFGTIHIKTDYNGEIVGEGAVITNKVWEYHVTVPMKQPQWIIKGKDTVGLTLSGADGWLNNQQSNAYIKTERGWKAVDFNQHYTLIPK